MRSATILTIALAFITLCAADAQTVGNCETGQAEAFLDIGNVRAAVYNTGGLFWRGDNPVYEVPRGGPANALFASGLWIGGPDWSAPWSFSVTSPTGTDVDPLPDRFDLAQNFPNPFNPTTTIRFSLPEAAQVTLDVFDAVGRRVARLLDARLPTGHHQVAWNAAATASGVYFYRMAAGSFRKTRTMLVLR